MSKPHKALLLVGDSDIARWPSDLLPQLNDKSVATSVSGHSGATLQEIVPHVETALRELDTSIEAVVLVVCAGENDIGNGLSLDETLSAFQALLQVSLGGGIPNRRLLFLGPKIEPWLDNDASSRKAYVKMSRAFQRACSKHERVVFVDSLTLFCGESANVPGATLGGKARADPLYFDKDQLHLSREGYELWKQVVEAHLVPPSETTSNT